MTVSSLAPRARRRMQPPPPADAVTQYALDVVSGRIVAGQLVRKACERHLRDVVDGPSRGLHFDAVAAEREIAFYPLFRHYKGEWGKRTIEYPKGRPIVLEGWQRFLVGSAFGWKREDGTRRFRQVYVEVGAKNGKTLTAAGIGVRLAFFDGEPGAEVYTAATKRDQAKISWNDAVQMVKGNPEIAERLETLALTITDLVTASWFRPLGKDSDSDQGINVHGAIIDEIHVHKDREVIDNIEKATFARRQPMIVKITTAGVKGQLVWESERSDAVAVVEGRATDDSMLVLIYTLDDGDDPFDEAVWPKANPNLGVTIELETLRKASAKAQRSPGYLAAYLRYHMNVPTSVATRAIDIDEWDRNDGRLLDDAGNVAETYEAFIARVFPPSATTYGGLDLASVRDLTALILVHRDADGWYNVLCRFWCPEEGIEHRSKVDGVPYDDWVRDGYLIATPGNVTDYGFVEAEAKSLAEQLLIAEVGYDRWNASQLVTNLVADGATMVPISQTHAGLAAGWRELEKAVLEHRMRHGGHPVLRWMAGNVQVETDASGNQKPSKMRSSERIDGMVALDMAVDRWIVNGEVAVWTAA